MPTYKRTPILHVHENLIFKGDQLLIGKAMEKSFVVLTVGKERKKEKKKRSPHLIELADFL